MLPFPCPCQVTKLEQLIAIPKILNQFGQVDRNSCVICNKGGFSVAFDSTSQIFLQVCLKIADVCKQLGVSRVVVGHTVVVGGKVAELCGGRLIMADVALSRAMGSRQLGEVMGLECKAQAPAKAVNDSEINQEGHKSGGIGDQESCAWVQKKEGNGRIHDTGMTSEEGGIGNECRGVLRVWSNDGKAGSKSGARLLSIPH